MFSLICAWTNGWASNRDAGDLRRHRAHYDVNVMGILMARLFIYTEAWWRAYTSMTWVTCWHQAIARNNDDLLTIRSRNKLQQKFHKQEPIKNTVCKMSAISFRPQCVKFEKESAISNRNFPSLTCVFLGVRILGCRDWQEFLVGRQRSVTPYRIIVPQNAGFH